jgi:cell division septation protein DedD
VRLIGEAKAAAVEERKLASAESKPLPHAPMPSEREPATAASAVAPGAGGWWVQIGSAREEKDGEALWSRSRAAHPTIFGDAGHAVVRADLGPGKGVFYRVHVGPFENAAAAGTVCGKLRAAHVDCFMVGPGGSIMTAPEPRNASVEPARPAETAPAKPAAAPTEKPTATVTPAAKPAPAEPVKPTPTARETKPAPKPEAAKAAAESETKKPDAKSDSPFRTMGLPGLPD